MASGKAIPTPRPLKVKGDKANNWRQFIRDWENYEIASGLDKEEERVKLATFLTVIGRDAMNIYDGFIFYEERTYSDVLDKFKTFCIGVTNECYQRYIFNSRQQESGESFDKYLSDLRRLVKTCEYGPSEDMLMRDKIVFGINCNDTRQELLQTPDLTLMKAIEICKSKDKQSSVRGESTQTRTGKSFRDSRTGKGDQDSAHEKPSRGGPRFHQKQTQSSQKVPDDSSKPPEKDKPQWIKHCRSCGKSHEMIKQKCFAFGKTCKFCGGKNHFDYKCRKKANKGGNQDSSDSEEDNSMAFNFMNIRP